MTVKLNCQLIIEVKVINNYLDKGIKNANEQSVLYILSTSIWRMT